MDEKSTKHLQLHGWVVIPNVISTEKCEKVIHRMEEFLCDHKFPKDPETWFNLIPKEVHNGGMCNTFGHFQELWDIRQDAGLARIWADYYNTSDLLVSMDRWSYYYAPAMTLAMRNKKWIHFDQGGQVMPIIPETKETYHCIQGYVNLFDSDRDEDGNLLVRDGAHRLHGKYFDYIEKTKGCRLQGAKRANNFVKLPDDWIQNLDEKPENYPSTIVKSRRGDVVLWYSTLPHQNIPPLSTGRTRSVCYVSFAPKSLLTDKRDMDIRKNAWANKRVTAHWASCFLRLSTAEKGTGYQFTLQHLEKHPLVLSPHGTKILGVST